MLLDIEHVGTTMFDNSEQQSFGFCLTLLIDGWPHEQSCLGLGKKVTSVLVCMFQADSKVSTSLMTYIDLVLAFCRPGRNLKRLSLRFWRLDLVLHPMANLEELLFFSSPVTDATVVNILAGCRNLKRLVLQANDLVTMETVNAYLRSGSTARLEVERCVNIQKAVLPEGAWQSSRVCVL
jgi:hypothetical protein